MDLAYHLVTVDISSFQLVTTKEIEDTRQQKAAKIYRRLLECSIFFKTKPEGYILKVIHFPGILLRTKK